MTKRRAIYGTAATSISLARCCPEAQLLFDRLISQADDQGRLQGDPMLVKAACMPLIDKATVKAVDRWLGELTSNGMILRYESEGQALIQIVKWWEHQDWMRHIYVSRWMPPEGWRHDRTKGSGERQGAADTPPDDGTLRPNDGAAPAQSEVSVVSESEDVIVSETNTRRGEDAREAPPPRPPSDISLHRLTTTHADLTDKRPNDKAVEMYRDFLGQWKDVDLIVRAMYRVADVDRKEYGFVGRVKKELLRMAA